MKKTMLTWNTLNRFEDNYITDNYTAAETEKIEQAAYVANMNRSAHPEWTEEDVFADFLRVLGIDKITTTPREQTETEEETEPATREAILDEATETIRSEAESARSAWSRGVAEYAIDLVNELAGQMVSLDDPEALDAAMLNGAASWKQYSEGGCSLIYDGDIAHRLCSYSELVRTKEGQRRPNARESWLDVQARALARAAKLAKKAVTSAASAARA